VRLQEHQAKAVLAQQGVPIPRGRLARTPAEARAHAEWVAGPVVVKAQVLVGGRGKAGGIVVADSPAQAERVARNILDMRVKGLPVRKVLVEEVVSAGSELYVGASIDRAARRAVVMASAEGGVEIEELARTSPEKIAKLHVEPSWPLRDYRVRQMAVELGLPQRAWREFIRVAQSLYRAFVASDASLVEVNPLVIGEDGRMVAADSKIVLDDNALYRHPGLAEMRDLEEEDELERRAREEGLKYIHIGGEIGCMVNGAGLAMATMDVIKLLGSAPANFLDIGGGARADKVASALRIILADTQVKAVLCNIFGGITRCDEVASGILAATTETGAHVPMVVRLVGTNEEEGNHMLADAGVITARSLSEAAGKAVEIAKG